MDVATLLAFAVAFFVFAASPGPDNMTIVARTLSHGPASGIAYASGMVAGILVCLALAVLGLSVIATEMGGVMTILRYAGAAYLVWMGFRMWTADPVLPEVPAVADRGDLLKTFLTGIALNLGNPKMPLFYMALLPHVVGPQLTFAQGGVLALTIVLVEVVVIGAHVVAASRARKMLRSPVVMRRVNRASGAVMVGAGVAVAASR
ncbi:LysE family translocator [Rhizobium panacihumi]|uniref:LysE family translocator n=1 Tax=Rhizobium panacihumi TaxID=2008450 RepID=UPI003D7B99AB